MMKPWQLGTILLCVGSLSATIILFLYTILRYVAPGDHMWYEYLFKSRACLYFLPSLIVMIVGLVFLFKGKE